MKLLRLKYNALNDERLLNDLDISFPCNNYPQTKINPICLVGINGSGKSQLLEIIAEIFLFIEDSIVIEPSKERKLLAEFEIEYYIPTKNDTNSNNVKVGGYEIKNKWVHTFNHIKIIYKKNFNSPKVFQIVNERVTELNDKYEIEKILPRYIVGYTSGENETLSIPFSSIYSDYSNKITKMANRQAPNKKLKFPRLVWTDYHMNIAILISNYLMRDASLLKIFDSEIKLLKPKSFRIIIQLGHQAAPNKEIRLTDELKSNIESLKACATCFKYEESEDTYILDYYFNTETQKAFQDHFNSSAFKLYTVFYDLAALNNLILSKKYREQKRKLVLAKKRAVKPPTVMDDDKVFRFEDVKLLVASTNEPIDYIGISDGEHQFIHVWGTIMMLEDEGVLFLLDEPETHYNPKWRTSFISNLYKIAGHRDQEFLITSHSPFIMSDCRRENVLIFKRNRNKVQIENPEEETFGASYDALLKLAFDVYPPVSNKSLVEIEELQKSDNLELLESKVLEFGDSIEKFFIYQRIEELKKANKDRG